MTTLPTDSYSAGKNTSEMIIHSRIAKKGQVLY